jgi:hypothetical protein
MGKGCLTQTVRIVIVERKEGVSGEGGIRGIGQVSTSYVAPPSRRFRPHLNGHQLSLVSNTRTLPYSTGTQFALIQRARLPLTPGQGPQHLTPENTPTPIRRQGC